MNTACQSGTTAFSRMAMPSMANTRRMSASGFASHLRASDTAKNVAHTATAPNTHSV